MATAHKSKIPFHISFTNSLLERSEGNRGLRAQLRKSWTSDNGPALSILAHYGVRIEGGRQDRVDAALLVAGAIGYGLPHVEGEDVGGMLKHLFRLTNPKDEFPDPGEQNHPLAVALRRLTASGYNRLRALRPLLLRCKQKKIGLDMGMLLADLMYWDSRTARRWIASYYGRHPSETEVTPIEDTTEEDTTEEED